MQNNDTTSGIRENFRKEIRRKQIEQIMAVKRQMFNSSNENFNACKHPQNEENIDILFERLRAKKRIGDTLNDIGMWFYNDANLYRYAEEHSEHEMHTLCIHLTSFILTSLIPSLKIQGEESEESIRRCLAVIANLMADKNSPHNELIEVVSEGISSCFPEVRSIPPEYTIEIGWILANSLCHELDLSMEAGLEKPIEDLLTISQEILLISSLEIIGPLFRSIYKFFQHVDTFFNAKLSKNGQIEHFKIHRMILLENTVEFQMSMEMGTTILDILPFIENNLTYAESYESKFKMEICKKGFKIISCGGSEKIMKAAFRLVRQLIVEEREIAVLMISNHFEVLMNCLLHNGMSIKIEALQTVQALCMDYELTVHLVETKNLETILVELIHLIRDSETQRELIMLTSIILQKSEHKYGHLALQAIDTCLGHKQGEVGREALGVLQAYESMIE